MAALIIRLVLVATLALNGVSVPMAMAHEMPAVVADTASASVHESHKGAHGAHHHGKDASIPSTDKAPADGAGGGCCDGVSCTCGCILPPALPFAFVLQLRHVHASQPPALSASATPLVAITVPFRPPAAWKQSALPRATTVDVRIDGCLAPVS